jgi:serine/threonine protein kinase
MDKKLVIESVQAESQQPVKRVGRYELLEIIGKGGFAEVWKANDPELDRLVAVKLPKANAAFHSESFLEEARKVAKLRHPGIVSVHDVGKTQNQWFIVSELIESGSLATQIKTNRPSHDESVRLVIQIAEALHYAHRQGFIHRDIKPQNILIEENGNPKIADFGIALSETQPVAQRSLTAGTMAYMSPEQGKNQTEIIDARTDIYSLGVVMYELLTGRLPFMAEDKMELFANILSHAPRTPRTIDKTIPVEIERLCLKAIAKNPAERFSTAQDFADELRKVISPTNQNGRSRLGFGSVLLFVIATSVFGFWWFNGLTQKRNEVIRHTNNLTDSISGPALSRVVLAVDEATIDLANLQKSLAELPAISVEQKTQQEASAELAAEMGRKALDSGDQTTAFTEFNRAIELNDRLPAAWHGRGVAQFNQGRFAEATIDLQKAITLDTQKPEYFKNLSFALAKNGQHDDAVQQILIGQSMTTLAERDEYKRYVAQVYDSRAAQRRKDNYHDGALADLDEAIRRDDSYPDAFDDRGAIRFNLKQFEEALADFTKAIELAPNRHEFFVHRGHALKALGRNAEADKDFEIARRLESKNEIHIRGKRP